MWDDDACRRYVQGSLDCLSHSQGGTVVIANSDTYWIDHQYSVGDTAQELSSDSTEKIRVMRSGLTRTIEKLRAAGHSVVLVQRGPRWTEWNPSRCNTFVIVRGHCSAQMAVRDAVAETSAVREVQTDVARAESVVILDSSAPLCPDGICSTQAPSFTRYQDTDHISVPQSIDLTDEFCQAIASSMHENAR